MGAKFMSEDITNKDKSNVFYDTFAEVVKIYPNVRKEVWEEAATIALYDTDAEIGLFKQSDIIIVYDTETFLPSIVTERIFKRNYSFWEWRRLRKYFKVMCRTITQELGFNIRVSYERDFIDYIHYKEEWWQWALKRSKQ